MGRSQGPAIGAAKAAAFAAMSCKDETAAVNRYLIELE
jgi:hypothetical protein